MGDDEGVSIASGVPTEEEISPVLQEMLRTSDLDTMTLRTVMGRLASHFEVEKGELAVRKRYVRESIEKFLEVHFDPTEPKPKVKKEAKKEEDVDEDDDDMEDDDGDEELEDDDDDERRTKKAKKRKRKEGGAADGRKLGVPGCEVILTNLERAVVLAEPLADFLNELVLPRTHVSRRINAYVKEHNLQDPKDRRKIICDEALEGLFKVPNFTFFSMNRLIAPLLYKRDEVEDRRMVALCEQCDAATKEAKQRDYDDKVARGEPVGKVRVKAVKGRSSKRMKAQANGDERKRSEPPYKLSPQLAELCGGDTMSRNEVLRRVWAYIKENGLNEGKIVKCDDKLKTLCDGQNSVVGLAINKYLTPHLTRL